MSDPLTDLPRTSSNGTTAQTTEPGETVDQKSYADSNAELPHDSPPGTPRWVKAFGIMLIVLLLALAGLHLTGNAPTHMGSSGAQHGQQAP